MSLAAEVAELFVLAIPVACVAWTVTHEEIFREPREFCADRSRRCRKVATRKFFYIFTCEYCFSHYVALAFLLITGYHLLYSDWRGYVIALFALVWIANLYMSVFGRLRLELRSERMEIAEKQRELKRNPARRAS
ncbi:MAG TPA: hypothetical protein VMG40_16585 [Bryobacteraceae bacterium]|nr:hypothetical protein [Bryobacteraceae bacterium]